VKAALDIVGEDDNLLLGLLSRFPTPSGKSETEETVLEKPITVKPVVKVLGKDKGVQTALKGLQRQTVNVLRAEQRRRLDAQFKRARSRKR